ncbi:MAG: glycosyltransferase family 2 protein [Acidobacteriota bacterium]|nr:MAG: glycosyltransferase family 2 protein [Acidobacteriota bacterium]
MKISAKIIVFDEEDNIARVCETVEWADEIVIVDSYSTDRTVEIARQFTDKIFFNEFINHGLQHEFADSKTSGDWIFWIDADERLTPELRDAILALKDRDPATLPDGFRIARRAFYLGRWIKHSGWYPDYVMRLYRSSKSYWGGIPPHETARVDGRIEKLEGELLHYTKKNTADHHNVIGRYAAASAKHYFETGRKVGYADLFFRPILAFIRSYFLKLGILDGLPGLVIAYFSAYGVFLKFTMLWEMRNVDPEDKPGK